MSPSTSTNFQNTIAHAQFKSDGGTISWNLQTLSSTFPFSTLVVHSKDILTPKVEFGAKITQAGTYFVDFSFIAEDGDFQQYKLFLLVNNTPYYTKADGGVVIRFFQQSTSQQYEVSLSALVKVSFGDIITFGLKTNAVPVLPLKTHSIKMNLNNLQQLGIH